MTKLTARTATVPADARYFVRCLTSKSGTLDGRYITEYQQTKAGECLNAWFREEEQDKPAKLSFDQVRALLRRLKAAGVGVEVEIILAPILVDDLNPTGRNGLHVGDIIRVDVSDKFSIQPTMLYRVTQIEEVAGKLVELIEKCYSTGEVRPNAYRIVLPGPDRRTEFSLVE